MSTPYTWFDGETVAALYQRLQNIGPENARLEVRGKGAHMTLTVVRTGITAADTTDPLNKAHPCPPDCP